MPDASSSRSEAVGEAAPSPFVDPSASLPGVVRPANVPLIVGAIHLLGVTVGSLLLLGASWPRHAAEAFAVLVGAGVLAIPPLSLLLAALGVRAERAVTGLRPGGIAAWGGIGFGIALSAHCAPLCLWPPLLLFGALVENRYADDLGPAAILALGSWVGLAVAAGVLVVSTRALARRSWAGVAPLDPFRSRLPASALIGGVYAVGATLPAVGCTIGFQRMLGSPDAVGLVASWSVLGLAIAALSAGVAGGWLRRASPLVPALSRGGNVRQLEIAGAMVAGHFLICFGAGLLVGMDRSTPEAWLMLGVGFVGVMTGTITWSMARTVRDGLERVLAVS